MYVYYFSIIYSSGTNWRAAEYAGAFPSPALSGTIRNAGER
jgi:hypothetical protein